MFRPGLLREAVQLAKDSGAQIALDLGSFEVVRNFQAELLSILSSGDVSCCFCNEVCELSGARWHALMQQLHSNLKLFTSQRVTLSLLTSIRTPGFWKYLTATGRM